MQNTVTHAVTYNLLIGFKLGEVWSRQKDFNENILEYIK